MILYNNTKRKTICNNIDIASTFFTRFKGLMFKKSLGKENGLLIRPCNSIHTYFMLFPIDVIFIDKNWKVIYILKSFKPWKLSKIIFKSMAVIELPTNSTMNNGIEIGDVLSIK